VDAAIDSVLARIMRSPNASAYGNRLEARRKVRDAMYIPTFESPVHRFAIGTDGLVWVQRTKPREGPGRWEAIDARGVVVGFVEVEGTIEEAMAEHLWVVHTDELDAPVITRYRIVRSRSVS
jgi:hypothetical protein